MNIFNSKSEKEEFLDNAKAARQGRIKEREIHQNANIIQAHYRRYKVCKKLKEEIIVEFDETIREEDGEFKFIKATDAFRIFRKFLFFYNPKSDKERFDVICKYIISSMFTNESKNSNFKIDYTSVCLEQKLTSCWLNQVKKLLTQCLIYLKQIRPELSHHQSTKTLYLNILINLTSCSTWTFQQSQTNIQPLLVVMNRFCASVLDHLVKNEFYSSLNELLMKTLCRTNRVLIKKSALVAALTLSMRPLLINKQNEKYSEKMIILFIRNIISIPALLHHVTTISDCNLKLFNSELLINCLDILKDEKHCETILNTLEGNYSLCLLANLVQFCHILIDFLKMNEQVLNDFVQIVERILEFCGRCVVSKQSSLTHWHSILGWFSQSIDERLHDSLPYVKTQLQLLWSAKLIQLLFNALLEINLDDLNRTKNEPNDSMAILNSESSLSVYRNLFRKAAFFVSRTNYDSMNSSILNNLGNNNRKLITPDVLNVCNICSTYVTVLKTLSQLRLEILTGICYQEKILIHLWKIIWSFGGKNNLNLFLNNLELDPKVRSPEMQMLILVCDCSTYLLTLLDDKEVYEEQRPFEIQDLIQISSFLNIFIFRTIYVKQIDIESTTETKYLFNSVHSLLILLYRRDSRREFAPKDHWLIKEIKISNFMKDLENNKKHAQLLLKKIPHIIPHKERVILFKKYVAKEKESLGLNDPNSASLHSTLVTVHRSRILEDSYQQLNKLQAQVLKGTIQVKFINEQGLSESGIDQNGVFKEFLEETMRKVLDPSLNLFAVTTEQRLYPSPTSNLHENHLSLFEFSGKMLGKAVYEGIVIDAPFASFFLNQIQPSFHNSSSQSNNQPSLLYSSIDQLPSLDPELYKSLCYIKHYPGDVDDFNLTFSVDENILGEVLTFELIPCGKTINVTKENKINYIHLMAHFRMHKQIDEQCNAFVKGFRSIISPDWLAMFNTPELQRLISGDNIPIDLNDLRRNTKYYGGFHNNHRLINWFWQVLENDFTNEELGLLLKFVTSCSKPPLLGFSYLQPSFSIRCIEVAEDFDVGDTVGSVLRGFLTISNGRLGKESSDDDRTELHWACSTGDLQKAKDLIGEGADIDATDEIGWTPLMIAVSGGKFEIAKMLIENHCDINISNKNGQIALHYAVSKNNLPMLKLLLDNGSNINTRDKYGQTPLHRAVSKGNTVMTKELLATKKVIIDVSDNQNNTVLHYAAEDERVQEFKLLVVNGADWKALNKD